MLPALVMTMSLAFGPKIVDLSLHIDDTARQSLQTSPDVDTAASMTSRIDAATRRMPS